MQKDKIRRPWISELDSLIDNALIVFFIFGGCCSNAWSLERLLKDNSSIGSALTFAQLLFIALQTLPIFITFRPSSFIPALKPRAIPISQWTLQVLMLTFASLLNNWAFSFHVPLTIQIVFRSGGLAISMVLGYLFLHRKYSLSQIASVLIVTFGVLLATLSHKTVAPASSQTTNPMPSSSPPSPSGHTMTKYAFGILMLTVSSILTGFLGILQERTYTKYGPHWKEGLFYTHILSLPVFAPLYPSIKSGLLLLYNASSSTSTSKSPTIFGIRVPYLFIILLLNVVTQLLCVAGANKLTSRVSSVTTNLVLTTRKALSLCISVWYFGNGFNGRLGLGALLVLVGTLLYSYSGEVAQKEKGKKEE